MPVRPWAVSSFQVPTAQANVAAALQHCLDTGSGGVVGEGDALVFAFKGLARSPDDILRGSGAVGGYRAACVLCAPGQGGQGQDVGQQSICEFFMKFIINSPHLGTRKGERRFAKSKRALW